MPPSRNRNSSSNPGPSQHLIQPQNTYKRFKHSLSCLCCGSRHHDTTPQVPGVDISSPGIQEAVLNGHASVVNANDVPRAPGSSSNPASTQAEGHKPLPIVEPVPVPVATQLQDAHGFNISGNPQFTNIGVNHNFYGGTNGLESLKEFVSFAALHDSAEQDPNRRCHPGTRENVLNRLRHWIDNPNTTDRIFWLYGPAGAGKSAIAQTIARGYNKGEVAATFFFYRSDPGRNDGNRLFTTIAWQLAFSILAVKDLIVHALDKTPHLPRKDVETQFEQLVVHPMNSIASQMPQLAPVVIIDGVDECFNEQLQRRFLSVIGNAVKDCRVPLRFIICSRPEALIEETLNQFKDFTLRIDLATLDDSNRDIEKYLVDQFSVIASKQGLDPSWPGQEIIEEIVFKSSGNFILASTLIRFTGDEDHSAVTQLEIVRKLKPPGTMSPSALLDELYFEILKRQTDQDFLKTFLSLLVGRTSIKQRDLHKDDAMLMNVSEKELHIKLRRMRSLFKFEPFIEVYHKSFLDFLQDSSRSGQYHVNRQGGQKQYLKLIVDSVVRHFSLAVEQPNCHETCRSSPEFKYIMNDYPPKIELPVEDWQETLKPLLILQDTLLNTSKLQPCRVAQVMRDLLLQLLVLQRNSQRITAAQAPEAAKSGTVTEWKSALMTEARENIPENDLDSCLSVLLSCPQESDSVLVVDTAIIDHLSSLLAFDYIKVAARVQSMSNAQKLVDIIDLLTNDNSFLSQCGPDARRKAAHLIAHIFARVPVFPRSILTGPCNKPMGNVEDHLELVCQTLLIDRILDHNYIVSIFDITTSGLRFTDVDEQDDSMLKWLERANPTFVTRIRVMLELARTIQYIHSRDITLFSLDIKSERIVLDSNLRTKVPSRCFFTWWVREASNYGNESTFLAYFTYESTISAFAELFHEVCFGDENILKQDLPTRVKEDARQLIERYRTKDPKSRPTIEDVVKEMESWKLT